MMELKNSVHSSELRDIHKQVLLCMDIFQDTANR